MVTTLPATTTLLLSQLYGRRMLGRAFSFAFGLVSASILGGVLIALGFEWLFDLVAQVLINIVRERTAVIFALQIVLGIALLLIGNRLRIIHGQKTNTQVELATTTLELTQLAPIRIMWKSFWLGFGMTIVGLPSGLTYLVAIDQILKTMATFVGVLLLIVFYNLIVFTPLIWIITHLHQNPTKTYELAARINKISILWIPRIIRIFLLIAGVLLILDAAWYFTTGASLIYLE